MSQDKGAEAEKPEDEGPTVERPGPQTTATPPVRPTGGAVEGIVATADGPLANVAVFAELKTVTDKEGRFVLEHLPEGNITLRVTSPTARFQDSTTPVTVDPNKKANVFVFLGELAGTVEGVVLDEKGNALASAEVFGLFRATKEVETMKVDERGHYSFKDVSPGTHFVRAKAPGFMIEGKSVGVVGSRSATCSFVLKPGSLSLVGKVMDSEGRGVDGEICLMKGGIVVMRINTKAGDGSYAFHDLVPANYELTIVAPGLRPKSWMGKLEKDEAVDFRLEVQPSAPPLGQTARWRTRR